MHGATHLGRAVRDIWNRYKRRAPDTPPPTPRPHKRQRVAQPPARRHTGHQGIIKSPSNGESNSSGSHVRRHTKKDKVPPFLNPTIVQCDTMGSLAAGTNSQDSGVTFLSFYGSTSAVNLGFPNANADIYSLWEIAQKDYGNRGFGASIPGGALGNVEFPVASIGPSNTGHKLHIHGVKTENIFTNDTSLDCMIYIYDLASKNTSATYYDPKTAWIRGVDQEEDALTLDVSDYGSIPTRYKGFNQFWKVLKLTKVELAAGRSHIHRYNYSLNKTIDTNVFYNNQVIAGVTRSQLIIVKGIQIVSATATPGTPIGPAPSKIFYKVQNVYKVTPFYAAPKKSLLFENISGSVGIAAVQQIDELTGLVQNPAVSA